MQTQQKSFKHVPLSSSRALRLVKDIEFNTEKSRLSCVLEPFRLDACPAYVCLSYTWGPPLIDTDEDGGISDIKKYELKIKAKEDEGFLSIQSNLFDASSQLSQSRSTGSPQYIWIDAICINQDDVRERESQVSMMGSIYSGAEKVIVWLGKDTRHLSNFAWFHTDAAASGYLQGAKSDPVAQRVKVDAPIFTGEYSTDAGMWDRWVSYCRFFEQRRWFSRAWVVQEIVLAREVEMICGNEKLSWDNIVAFALGVRLSGIGSYLQTMRDTVDYRSVGDEVMRLDMLREACAHDGPDQEPRHEDDINLKKLLMERYGVVSPSARRFAFLQHIICMLRPFDSSDPRDKVYAALGIVNKFLPSGSNHFIYPEYDIPVREVYESTAKFLLEHLPYLSALSLVEDRSKRKIADLPSWVPDFSSQQGDGSLQGNVTEPYNASAGQSLDAPWSISNSVLSLGGSCHDTVAQLGMSLSRSPQELPHSGSWLVLDYLEILYDALRLCLALDLTYITGQGRIQALWRTLIADQCMLPAEYGRHFCYSLLWHLGEAAMSGVQQLTDILNSIMSLLDEFAASPTIEGEILVTPGQVILYVMQRCAESEQLSVEQNAWLEKVFQDCKVFAGLVQKVHPYRRLYTTTKGYIGLGPLSMQVGDEVWVLCDARTLFVLRPQSNENSTTANSTEPQSADKFSLVGETYLHGFMRGEASEVDLKDRLHSVDLI